ncbi:MAG: hypothetical protein AUJ97_06600 [Bacteroidetes bacterium CG2_30_32_10]|nr:MAG: hypothetical protein AUJ97_06600 [Bacteroidetes bacterium CG2_30_32_10]
MFIGLAKVYDAATGLNAAILGNSKYYFYFLFFIFFVAILAIINNLIFIPMYNIVGSAIATVITIFLYNTILVLFVKIKLKVQPFTLKNIKALLVISSFFIINAFIPLLNNPYFDSIIRSITVLILFLIAIYKFKLSPDINNFINSFYQKLISKIKK